MPRQQLYLEDLEIGNRFVTETHRLDAAEIVAFARQFDPQTFHTNAEAAKHSFFKGLTASGWHTSAITMRLLVTSGPQIAGGVVGMEAHIEWPRPVRPGDTLRVESEVKEIVASHSRPEIGVVTLHSETLNQNGEPVQIMAAKLRVPRRS